MVDMEVLVRPSVPGRLLPWGGVNGPRQLLCLEVAAGCIRQ